MATTKPIIHSLIQDRHLFLRFWQFLIPHFNWLGLSLLAVPFSIVATILFPWLVVIAIDKHLAINQAVGFNQILVYLGLVVLLSYLTDACYTYFLQKTAQLTVLSMRQNLYERTLDLPKKYFDKQPSGITLSRLTNDFEALNESFATGVLALLTGLLKTFGLYIFLFYLNWRITIAFTILMLPLYFILRYLRLKMRIIYDEARKAIAIAISYLQECIIGVRTIQLFAAEKKVIQNFEQKNRDFFSTQIVANYYESSLFSIVEGFTTLAVVVVLWYGTSLALRDLVTIGVLIGFLNALQKIFVPIRELTQQLSVIQRALSALDHINKLFEEPTETEPKISHTKKLQGFESLEIEDLHFSYGPGTPDVLKGVNFKISKGERVAVVGATGSGKSTLMRLLMRQYKGYKGSIRLNGIELTEISRPKLNQIFSKMDQNVYLFNASVAFNIGLGYKTDVEIERAAEYVQADQFIQNLNQHYEFELIKNGSNLSEGQAQLIAFARAIAQNNELFLLDEATSAIDSVTEALIEQAIEKIFQEKTIIAIAHRLSTIQRSDQILVMDQGQIIERGNHQQLLQQQGAYHKLVHAMESVNPAKNQ